MGFLGTLLNIGAAVATGGASAVWRYAALAFMALSGGPEQTGPRLDNLTVDLDGDGQILSVGWGVWPVVSLRLLFTTGLIEHKKTKKKGGFFGTSIGAAKVSTFSYSTKCLAVGSGRRISRLRRLKLNEFPLYDYNGGNEQGGELVWNGQFWEGDTRVHDSDSPTHIRVFPGTLDQPVSPVLVEAKGEGQWTNYPGLALVEVSIPNLERYGNSQPRIWAEFEYDVTDLPSIIEEIGSWVGLLPEDFNLTALEGLSVSEIEGEGFVADQRKSAGEHIADLMLLFHFSLPEIDGVATAVLKGHGPSFSFTPKQLQVTAGYDFSKRPSTPLAQPDQHDLTQVMEILFRDTGREGATGYRRAYRYQNDLYTTGTRKKTTIQTAASMGGARASNVARIALSEEWAGAFTFEGYGGVEHLIRAPGDEGWIETADGPKYVVIDHLKPPLFGPIQMNFAGLDPLVYGLPLRDDTAGLERATPIEPGSPIVFASEMPLARVGSSISTQMAFVIGLCRSIRDLRWRGADVTIELKKPGGDWKENDTDETGDEAIIGELTASWSPSRPGVGFTSNGPTVQVWNGTLQNATGDAAATHANLALFENGLLAIVNTVNLTSTGSDSKFYSFTSLESGVFGSDDFIGEPLTPGMRFVMLTDETGEWLDGPYPNIVFGDIPVGTQVRVKVREQEGDGNEVTFDMGVFEGENVRPPSPVFETASRDATGSVSIVGRGRTRYLEDALLSGLPSGSNYREYRFPDGFKYQVKLEMDGSTATVIKYSTNAQAAFSFAYTVSELAALLGRTTSDVASHAVKISLTLYGEFGLGRTSALTIFRKSVTVPAISSAWTDTGVTLALGDRINITATGTASHIAGQSYGPDGSATDITNGFHYGALVGVVMQSGVPTGNQSGSFLVGSSKEVKDLSGRLYLRFNDDVYFADNTGSYAAVLQILGAQ